ncbi:MAG: antibiotic biosynthesis monooxygenase [Acidobacteriota bacterium]
MAADDPGVTVVVVRTVRSGMEANAEDWLHGVSQVATRVPGHLGITIFRPRGASRDYTFVFRFDTDEHLHAWETSAERREWVQRAEAFTERVTVYEHTGLETWFASPGSAIAVPPRWKMVCVTWAVAFPLIQILSSTLGPALGGVHPIARGAVIGLAMVSCMTYAAMPWTTRVLRKWLYPAPPP